MTDGSVAHVPVSACCLLLPSTVTADPSLPMTDSAEPDDTSQDARTSAVRKLVDDVLDKLNSDQEAEHEGESGEESDGGPASPKQDAGDDTDDTGKQVVVKRKSTRSTRWKGGRHRAFGQKGRSRRLIFKKHVFKSPTSCAVPVTSDFVFDRGLYYQIGDIVSVIDAEDGNRYYAQIRGFLTDEYCEKFVALNWLLPTREAPADGSFHAAFFVPGPEEDIPRPLQAMQFEQHAPPDYFAGYSTLTRTAPSRTTGYIWTSLSPRIVRLN